MHRKALLVGLGLLGAALLLAACGGGETPPATPCPEAVCPELAVVVPFEDLWAASAHADASAEAFNHWNEDTPAEIPTECARCHSQPGTLDYLGADGTAAGVVDNPAPIGTVIDCTTCHNAGTLALASVTFPSGAEVTGLGPEARCMTCHQGAASMVQVDEAITGAGLADMDTVSADLGFVNIHYTAAAASQYGTLAQGGYQYQGQSYDARFAHVDGLDTCVGCHDNHSLELRFETCATCHTGASTVEDLRNIRMAGSTADYDGDGSTEEGIYYEIEGLRAMLLRAMQSYATETAGTAIAYSPDAYPYFFIDTNGNGTADPDEAAFPNSFNAWTGRLLQAAYNYQASIKDPGAYAHGGKYIIELLYDSIADLNTVLSSPIDLSTASRIDAGHFAGSEEAFRHWDEDGAVPGTCSRCHSATGLPFYLAEGVAASQPLSNGLMCTTCHDDLTTFTRRTVEEVTFPSGAVLSLPNPDANLCLECHQGRQSTVSINSTIRSAAVGDDQVMEGVTFRNPHYFAAGATLFGSEAHGAYEYTGQTYVGRFQHVEGYNTCVNCHGTHDLTVQTDACVVCHTSVQSVEDLGSIRGPMSTVDSDGDGDSTEGIAGEVATMQEALYAALQNYATSTIGTGIVFSPSSNPYWFIDSNANGQTDPDEVNSDNRYATWAPRLLRAAYNYTWVTKDPGSFAHNSRYIMAILYDSIGDLGGSTAGMTRP
jgi:hypothetical protein